MRGGREGEREDKAAIEYSKTCKPSTKEKDLGLYFKSNM